MVRVGVVSRVGLYSFIVDVCFILFRVGLFG